MSVLVAGKGFQMLPCELLLYMFEIYKIRHLVSPREADARWRRNLKGLLESSIRGKKKKKSLIPFSVRSNPTKSSLHSREVWAPLKERGISWIWRHIKPPHLGCRHMSLFSVTSCVCHVVDATDIPDEMANKQDNNKGRERVKCRMMETRIGERNYIVRIYRTLSE